MSATAAPTAPSALRAGRPRGAAVRGGPLWGRVLGTDLRRSGARAVGLVVAVAGSALVLAEALPATSVGIWSSSWAGALWWIDSWDFLWTLLAATSAAWVAGRERRRRTEELLAVTPRPAWQRVSTTWAAVVVGVLAGWLVQAGITLAAVFPEVSYSGGRWPVVLALLALGVLVGTTVGFAAGRMLPGRLVAPGVAVVGFVLLAWLPAVAPQGLARLLPVGFAPLWEGVQVRAGTAAGLAVWSSALTATALVLAVARRRWLALVPAAAAVVAVPVVLAGSATEPDPAAQALVCAQDAGLPVCVQQVHAGLLDDAAPLVREQAAAVRSLVSWSSAQEAVPGPDQVPPPDVLVLPGLESEARPFRSGLSDPEEYRGAVLDSMAISTCGPNSAAGSGRQLPPAVLVTDPVAAALLRRSEVAPDAARAAAALHERLAADPAAARAWMQEYQVASRSCDLPVLQRLAGS
ncbi:hypothetical protein [Quadrisphaera sp. DSM 44207]|uniref:hypothetical protein n=1 Tax=Quadrisphaera sp. DSM 44207 TaxID=1881057 RepID=UPI00088EFF79|nr:hypothetical protein [Quadrisphaera sp. DSM 44207]SDQ06832.1 hypothetical protein SAMN05428996_0328 [Quadrisphaera sp. DSM 44207]